MDSVDYYLIQNAKEKIKIMQNEDIKFCDYIKLKKQLEKIEKAMVSDYFSCNISLKKEPYKFDLFNCECSTGKTFSVVTKVVLFLEKWAIDIYNPKGMLFVMQNIAPCKYYANKINKELFDNNIIAETVDSDMDDVEIKNKLNRYPVIFLTHEKYKVLAQDEEERKQFSKDRILLVIDEFINMSKKIWIDNIEYEKLIVVFKDDEIKEKFRNATKELKDYFVYLEKNGQDRDKELHIKNFKTDYSYIFTEIEKIKQYIKDNFDDQDLIDFYNANKKRSIYNVLDEVKEFFGGTSILESGKLYTVKRNLQLWGLSKNIILDGSGTLNYAYYLQRNKINFRLEKDYKVLDHKNFTVEHIKINSTKTSKNRYSNYYNLCYKILCELGIDKTLVVCRKEEHQDKNGNEITKYFDVPFINHWQNFLGSNVYGDLKNMLIVDTFNMSEKDYILEYLYYSNETLKDDEDIKVLTKDNHRYFTNKEIEEYKNRRIANEFYQAFKRINRKLNYTSRIVIITIHTEAVILACDMLKNCEYKDITDKYKEMLEYKEEYKQSTKNSDRIIKAKEILSDIINNNFQYKDIVRIENNNKIIPKQRLRNLLGIESAPNFRRDVLSKKDFKNFLDENSIEDKGQNLIIHTKT